MDFGFTLKLDLSPAHSIALTRQAEAAGFSYGWVFDSHVLWLEPYPMLTLMAQATERMRLGTCVTNPATRDPSVTASALGTLNLISGGRMVLGIGRGDSSRRVLGKKPTTLAQLGQAVTIIREMAEGRTADYDGEPLTMPWVPPPPYCGRRSRCIWPTMAAVSGCARVCWWRSSARRMPGNPRC